MHGCSACPSGSSLQAAFRQATASGAAALQQCGRRQRPSPHPHRACRLPPELVPEHSLAENAWQIVASDKEAFLRHLHAGTHPAHQRHACVLWVASYADCRASLGS